MTKIARWNPLQEMQSLHNQIDRLFGPVFGGDYSSPGLTSGNWMPPVDIEETKDRLFVRAELPGMRQEDIAIEYENGVLSIRGERRFDREQKEKHFHRVERSYGSFARSFTLPSGVDVENVRATYENGVLELELPKREEAKARRIEIGGGSRPREIETKSA